jgi:hypothetical protein
MLRPGAANDYPYLTPLRIEELLSRSGLCATPKRHDRAVVTRTWKNTRAWTTDWLARHPDRTDAELATAIYTVTAAGDTASELLTRAQAAIEAVNADGIWINRDLFNHDPRLGFTETRPYEWRHAVERAATLIDQVANPQLAAILAVSVVYRRPASVRRVMINGVAPDGSITSCDYPGRRAIPPQLRLALAAQRERLTQTGARPIDPFLPGEARSSLCSSPSASPSCQAARGEREKCHQADGRRREGDQEEPGDGAAVTRRRGPHGRAACPY